MSKLLNLRHEYKFLLDPGAYLQLSKILREVMPMDHHSQGSEGYNIRSLYFDDVYNTAASEKYLGYIYRKKFRIRIYDRSDRVIKLEIKKKYHDCIQKVSCNISREEYDRILDGNISFLHNNSNDVKEEYYLGIRNKLLKPKVIVDYTREAYTLPYNHIRVTFDKDLSAAKPHKNIFGDYVYSTQVGSSYKNILEVKYDNFFPEYIRRILEIHCANRLAVSKYLICREYVEK